MLPEQVQAACLISHCHCETVVLAAIISVVFSLASCLSLMLMLCIGHLFNASAKEQDQDDCSARACSKRHMQNLQCHASATVLAEQHSNNMQSFATAVCDLIAALDDFRAAGLQMPCT